MENENLQQSEPGYTNRVWIKGGIYSLIIVLLLLIKATFGVMLLILAGTLIAVFFHGLSGLICRKTKWKSGICLTISVLGTLLIISALVWLIGSKIANQVSQLSESLPQTIEKAKTTLSQNAIGKKIVEKATAPGTMQKAQSVAQSFFKTTFGIFGDLYSILFIGIFLTVSPQIYKNGMVQLIPKKHQNKGEEVLDNIGNNLKKWLKGKIFAMFVVFVLTSIGLLIIGVPLWLVLALIAGLLNFIPNFGPLIAMLPAVLVGLLQGVDTALYIAGLYLLVQLLESNFITPTVQQKLVSIPPALILIAQLFISPLTGGWGLVLATPIMLIVMLLVQDLYIKPRDKKP